MHLALWQTSFPLGGICKPGMHWRPLGDFLAGRRGSPGEWKGHPSGKEGHSSGKGSLGSWRRKELPNVEKGHSPRRVVHMEQKELPNMEKGCSSGREVSPRRYVPKGRVKLWSRMHYILLENDVLRDWMNNCEEKRMGFPRQYGSNKWGEGPKEGLISPGLR